MKKIPNPGSPEARARGCKCSETDNDNGKGVPVAGCEEPQFWINLDCPLHGGRDRLLASILKDEELQ